MLEVETQEKKEYFECRLKGRIDGMSSKDLEKYFDQWILDNKHLFFLMDFKGIDYISSAGLRVFLTFQKKLKEANGEILFCHMGPDIRAIFKSSGFDRIFKIYADKREADVLFSTEKKDNELKKYETDDFQLSYVEFEREEGTIFTVGSADKMDSSSYGLEDIHEVSPDDTSYSLGFAALGASSAAAAPYLGESVTLNKSMFFYPAMKNSAVDFFIYQGNEEIKYQYLYGAAFNGEFNAVISFKPKKDLISLDDLLNAVKKQFDSPYLGIVIMAESKGVKGMNLIQVPMKENRPENGKKITDGEVFPHWFDFPVDYSDMNKTLIGAGFLKNDEHEGKSPLEDKIFGGKQKHHIHCGVFERSLVNLDINGFSEEMDRKMNELRPEKVQHILGDSRIGQGLMGIVKLKG